MEELKNILNELKKFRVDLKLEYDDNCILDCATRIFNAQNNSFKQEDEPITERQKYKLESLGYKGTYDLTKLEASRMINKLLKERK